MQATAKNRQPRPIRAPGLDRTPIILTLLGLVLLAALSCLAAPMG